MKNWWALPLKDGEAAAGTLNITDNDSLACSIGVDVGADLAILMSDVDGIYDRPPKEEGARSEQYVYILWSFLIIFIVL